MPVVDAGTSKLGLVLWQNMPVALAVEAAVTMAGSSLVTLMLVCALAAWAGAPAYEERA